MRGRSILLAGLAALLPGGAGLVGSQPLQAQAARPFSPPTAPLVLTRTVSRSLADGGTIVARRSYAVRIAPRVGGYRVDGELIESTVKAPPGLSELARIEERRSDRGLFPILLDPRGRIEARSTPHSLRGHRAHQDLADGLLKKAALTPAERVEAGQFAESLLAGGGPSAWPEDLFNPRGGEQIEQRRIALPDGNEGSVTITVAATTDGPGGMVGSLQRTVITALGGTTRTTREVWTLTPGAQ